jgi:hypothetical protein
MAALDPRDGVRPAQELRALFMGRRAGRMSRWMPASGLARKESGQ